MSFPTSPVFPGSPDSFLSQARGKLKGRNMRQPYQPDEIQRAMSAASPLYVPAPYTGGSFESMSRPQYRLSSKNKVSISAKFGTPVITTPNIFYSFVENTQPSFVADILTTENALSFVTQPTQNIINPRFLIYTLSSASISTSPIKLVLNGNTIHRRLNDITAIDVTDILVPFGQQNWLVIETGGIIVPFALIGVWTQFTPIEIIINTIASKPQFQFNEIAAMCPITGQPIEIPSRGINCQHENCFDLYAYITTRQGLGVWNCPICGQPTPINELIVGTVQQKDETNMENIWGMNETPTGFDDGEGSYIPW